MRTWRVVAGPKELIVELRDSGGAADGDARGHLASLLYEAKFAPESKADRVVMDVYSALLGAPLSRGWPGGDVGRRMQMFDDIRGVLARAVDRGALRIRDGRARSVVVPLDGPVKDALGPLPEPTAWIALELVDQDGNAVPGVDYLIECDDGRTRTGTTNASGKAREEGLHDGNCKVSFPKLDGPSWASA
jgi:hypothetical protein